MTTTPQQKPNRFEQHLKPSHETQGPKSPRLLSMISKSVPSLLKLTGPRPGGGGPAPGGKV